MADETKKPTKKPGGWSAARQHLGGRNILVLNRCKKPDDALFINPAEHFVKGKRQITGAPYRGVAGKRRGH